ELIQKELAPVFAIINGEPTLDLCLAFPFEPHHSYPSENTIYPAGRWLQTYLGELAPDQTLCYFGFERFLLFQNSSYKMLSIQPTHKLTTGHLGGPGITSASSEIGLGPICLGRGVEPQVLDLLCLSDKEQ